MFAVVVLLSAALAASSSSAWGAHACEDLADVFIELRDFYRDDAVPDKFSMYSDQAEHLSIDLNNDQQIRRLACDLVAAQKLDDVKNLLSIPDKSIVPYVMHEFIYSLSMEIDIMPDILQEYEAAFQFLDDSGFPDFPLGLNDEEVLHLLIEAGYDGINMILGRSSPQTPGHMAWLADAMAEAQNVEEFNYFTYGNFQSEMADFEATREEMEARMRSVTMKQELQPRVLALLEKYNILSFVEK